MRRFLILALAVPAALLVSGPAQAFHRGRHHYYQPVAPVAGVPFAPVGAAPISVGQILQFAQAGYQIVSGLEHVAGGIRQQQQQTTPARQMVSADVQQTITRVDKALKDVAGRSNSIAALSPLYKDVKKVGTTTSSSTSSGGGTGGGGGIGPPGDE
jgi:hypothetical protein